MLYKKKLVCVGIVSHHRPGTNFAGGGGQYKTLRCVRGAKKHGQKAKKIKKQVGGHTTPIFARVLLRMMSRTALNTTMMLSVSVAHVRCA